MLTTIIWYLSWPVMILVSYVLVRIALGIFEKKVSKKQELNQ